MSNKPRSAPTNPDEDPLKRYNINHNEDLIAAHRERLNILQVQAARYGDDVPPHILVEIKRLIATIRALDTVETLTPDNEATDQRVQSNKQATRRMIATVQATENAASSIRSEVRQQISEVKTDLQYEMHLLREEVNNSLVHIRDDVKGTIDNIRRGLWQFARYVLLIIGIALVVVAIIIANK